MSNSSEHFSYPTIYSNFKILDHLFFELSVLTHRQTDRQTDRQWRQVLYTCGLNRKYNKLSPEVKSSNCIDQIKNRLTNEKVSQLIVHVDG